MDKNGQVVPFPSRGRGVVTMTQGEIVALRQEIARAPSTRKLKLILDAPSPRAVVQSMHPQEFYHTVKEIGVSDSSELLPLARTRQITFALDVDCWKKDEFQPDALLPWLRFLGIKDEWPVAEAVLKGLDSEALVLFFQPWFTVHEAEKNEPPPLVAGELVQTVDRMYYIELPFDAEDDRAVMAHGALELFQTYGFEFTHRLFEAIRHNLPTELNEIAYQFRKVRLEELGFVDYYDAIGLYQPLLPDAAPFPTALPEQRIPALPDIYRGPEGSLFQRSLAWLSEERVGTLHYELVHLTNKMMAAERVELSSSSSMRGIIQSVIQMLDLGLEIMAGHNNPREGGVVLSDYHLEWVYRAAFTELSFLRRRARLLAKRPELTLVEGEWSLLDTPWAVLLDGLRAVRPMFHTGFLEESEGQGQARAFSSLHEMSQARAALDIMEFLPTLFFAHFDFSYEALTALEYKSPAQRGEVRFSHLLLTALAHYSLHGRFSLTPLQEEEVSVVLRRWLQKGDSRNQLNVDVWGPIAESLLSLPEASASERRSLEVLLEMAGLRLLNQAGSLDLEGEIDLRYLDLFLLSGA